MKIHLWMLSLYYMQQCAFHFSLWNNFSINFLLWELLLIKWLPIKFIISVLSMVSSFLLDRDNFGGLHFKKLFFCEFNFQSEKRGKLFSQKYFCQNYFPLFLIEDLIRKKNWFISHTKTISFHCQKKSNLR